MSKRVARMCHYADRDPRANRRDAALCAFAGTPISCIAAPAMTLMTALHYPPSTAVASDSYEPP